MGALVGRLEAPGLGAIEIGSVALLRHAPSIALAVRCGGCARPVPRKTGAAARLRYGVSLAKRAQTPWSDAAAELSNGVSAFAGLADYVTLEPGPGRPALAEFIAIVAAVARHRDALVCSGSPRLPLMVKLAAPWLRERTCWTSCAGLAAAGVDGLLLSAEGMAAHEHLGCCAVCASPWVGAGLVSVGGVCAIARGAAAPGRGRRSGVDPRRRAPAASPAVDRPRRRRWCRPVGSASVAQRQLQHPPRAQACSSSQQVEACGCAAAQAASNVSRACMPSRAKAAPPRAARRRAHGT